MYINDGRDYEIIAYKYYRTKQIALDSLCNPNNIIWTWIAKDYEQIKKLLTIIYVDVIIIL